MVVTAALASAKAEDGHTINSSLEGIEKQAENEKARTKTVRPLNPVSPVPLTRADIIATTTLSVFPSTPLNYHWKGHGINLYIPNNAMKPSTPPLTLNIQAIQSDSFQLPDNMELVSAVYSVSFPQKFFQPVAMEIQHCASLEHPPQLSSLSFVTVKSTQGVPPYQFHPLPGGIFSANSCYGSIQLSHSCEVAIVNDGSTKTYTALTYYVPQSATAWLVHFVIIWDLDLYLQSVKSHYSGEGTEDGPAVKMTFAGDEIELDISQDGITLASGWFLEPLQDCRVQRSIVDSYQPNHLVPGCQLQLKWTKPEVQYDKLSFLLKLIGAIPHETCIEIIKNTACPEFSSLNTLNILSDVGFSAAYWRELGGRLKPDLDMDAIEANHPKVERCLEEVVGKWQRDGDDPSWEKLAEAVALCKEGGGKEVAIKIRQKVGLVIEHANQKNAGTTSINPDATKRNSGVSSSPPEKYKQQLLRILHKDSENIAMQFCSLTIHTINVLEKSEASVIKLKKYISLFPMTEKKSSPTLADIVQSADDVYDVLIILKTHHFLTFYKFQILEFIIKILCSDNVEVMAELEEYKLHFEEYIKRRVCESSLYYSGEFNPDDTCTPKEGCNLILITDDHWDHESSLKAVLGLESAVADIFNIKDFALGLKKIEKHCLKLYHTIPMCLERDILSINQEQVQRLISCGIAEIYCGRCHIVLKTYKETLMTTKRSLSVEEDDRKVPYHSPIPSTSMYLECAPVNLPVSPLKQEQTSPSRSPYHRVGLPYKQAGSPYSQMGSPPYDAHSPSPHAISDVSPGISSPQKSSASASHPISMDGMATFHPMVPFSTACTVGTTCTRASMYDLISQAPAMYSTPQPPMCVNETCSPYQLPSFQSCFDTPLHSESTPVSIEMVPIKCEVSVINYPPTPPNPEDNLDMCPMPPSPPPHLHSFPTIPITARRKPKKPSKIVSIEVDDSDIKDIPTSTQLWEFTLRVLKKPKYNYMVSWENRKEGLFRFHDAQAFAALWGKHRNRPTMSYDKVARALRYYYKRNILEQVGGRLTYRFAKRLSKLYLSDV